MRLALIAVQLEVTAESLASPGAYRARLEDAAARAIEDAGPADMRLVVFPEGSGHLALLALASPAAQRGKTLAGVLASAGVRRPLEVLRGMVTTRVLDPRHAVLAAFAPDAEQYWRGVFGPLARQHHAYIVAGSHLRLGPAGDVTNASMMFGPDGRLVSTTDKINLIPGIEDRGPKGLGLARGSADHLPIVDTPAGPVCTLVCYDAFRAPHTSLERFVRMGPRIAERGGVTVVANPAANPWPWRETCPWAGVGEGGSRELRWDREGLPGSLAETAFARWGVTAHLVARVLDQRFDGQSEILERHPSGVKRLARTPHHDRGGHVVTTVTC